MNRKVIQVHFCKQWTASGFISSVQLQSRLQYLRFKSNFHKLVIYAVLRGMHTHQLFNHYYPKMPEVIWIFFVGYIFKINSE
jgi:hypothetical protein